MVWAVKKLVIHDDLLEPVPEVRLNYSGSHPLKVYDEAKDLLIKIFGVREEDIQEKSYNWRTTPEGRKIFKVKWELIKDLDKFSYYRISVGLEGSELDEKGKMSLDISGGLRTEYPQDTVWERSLIYEILRMFWHKVFYESKRSTYLKKGRKKIQRYIDNLKAFFKLKR